MPATLQTTTTPLAKTSQPKIRKAAAVALTRTAWEVRSALMGAMRQDFDRPTPFTMRAFRVDMATAATLEAVVWAQPLQARYLVTQIEGGDRSTKGFEKRMHLFGGEVALPGAGAKLNQYGNMSLAFIKKVAGQDTKRFFTGTPTGGSRPEGVYERKGGQLIPMMVFADDASYTTSLDVHAVAERTVAQQFHSQLLRAIGV